MSKQHRRGQPPRPAAGDRPAVPPFTPVPGAPRRDGWTPARQVKFVAALAATANVTEACAVVGMSPRSFYDLRRRPDAASFRQAVEAALDHGVCRLAEAMMGRAIDGVATPIFFQGEQIGERRRYDERLGMWILAHRAPDRYGAWRDRVMFRRDHPDAPAEILQHALANLVEDLRADLSERARPTRVPVRTVRHLDDPEEVDRTAERAQRWDDIRRKTEMDVWTQRLAAIERGEINPTSERGAKFTVT